MNLGISFAPLVPDYLVWSALAVAAVLAMLHDVILVVGLFAWLQKPIDGIFLAAAMTIVGLSVNDTVVVYDRIRETQGLYRTDSFENLANRAINATLSRTVITGVSPRKHSSRSSYSRTRRRWPMSREGTV